MSRFDNAGMDRPDRYLVQAFAYCWQKFVRNRLACGGFLPERVAYAPKAEVEPGACIRCAYRFEAGQITNRTLRPDCRWMARRNTRKFSGFTGVTDDGDVARPVQQCHMNVRRVAPQTKQCATAVREQVDCLLPSWVGHSRARPRPVPFDR